MTETRQIPFGRPWITDEDRKAVLEVLEGHVLTHGPQGKAFETEFSSFMGPGAYSVSVSSGMAALHLAYLHFGIGAGDEVIVPAQTHSATAHAVEWVGATPVFVDCEPATGNVNAAIIEAALTPRTKAISVVHFDGIPCNMPEIVALAAQRGLKADRDCALAVGARRWEGRTSALRRRRAASRSTPSSTLRPGKAACSCRGTPTSPSRSRGCARTAWTAPIPSDPSLGCTTSPRSA